MVTILIDLAVVFQALQAFENFCKNILVVYRTKLTVIMSVVRMLI